MTTRGTARTRSLRGPHRAVRVCACMQASANRKNGVKSCCSRLSRQCVCGHPQGGGRVHAFGLLPCSAPGDGQDNRLPHRADSGLPTVRAYPQASEKTAPKLGDGLSLCQCWCVAISQVLTISRICAPCCVQGLQGQDGSPPLSSRGLHLAARSARLLTSPGFENVMGESRAAMRGVPIT